MEALSTMENFPTGRVSSPPGTKHSASSPYFSVVIPTMNRPGHLEKALKSVAWQTFGDFDLVVSDNSSDEGCWYQNQATVRRYQSDPRVRYIRPPTWMNMPDHWEFATRQALGRYVVVLTDRHVMRPSALKFLERHIRDHGDSQTRVISWHSGSALLRGGILHTTSYTGSVDVMPSKRMLTEFAKFANWRATPLWVNRLPRSLNSCYRQDLATAIRRSHGRMYWPTAPDYTGAYLLLAYSDHISYIDRPLFLSHGNQSNGGQALVHGGKAYLDSLAQANLLADAPSRLPTITNYLVRDLSMVKRLVGDRLTDLQLDLVGYFMCNYKEFLHMERIGSLQNMSSLYTQWRGEVRQLSKVEQAQISAHLEELGQQRPSLVALRRLIVRAGLDPAYHSVIGIVRNALRRASGRAIYTDALDAAERTDFLLSLDTDPRQGDAVTVH